LFGCISFCIGDKCIEINGKKLSLGDLTTEFLNLPKDKYAAMRKQLELAQSKAYKYIISKQLSDWYDANEEYIKLDAMICEIPCLDLVREETDIFEETRQLTAQISMFENDDCELTDYDLEVLNKITAYEDYLEHPENYGGTNKEFFSTVPQPPIPEPPPEKTRALLVYPGNLDCKWEYYKNYCDAYAQSLYDIESFNNTIFNFIKFFLSSTEKMNADSYASALYDFFNFPRADKMIANPMRGTGLFTANDQVIMRHMPRETFEGSGIYKIYQYYEVESLQALLKMDFYKALESGYIIRKCEYCGKYFLLKKGYKTKYCDNPAPDNPKYTCAQLGYHRKGIKELQADNPKAQSLRRCYLRIDKDLSRGVITRKEKEKIYRTAQDLYYDATTKSGTYNEEFEQQLASKNLYPLCNVVRKTKPRGRPKSE
jgi:hypothetical protein